MTPFRDYQCSMTLLKIRRDLLKYWFEHIDIYGLNKLILGVNPMKISDFVNILNRKHFELPGTCIDNK